MYKANTILRDALQRIEARAANILAGQPADESAECLALLAKGLEEIANLAIKARADARTHIQSVGCEGWWPVG